MDDLVYWLLKQNTSFDGIFYWNWDSYIHIILYNINVVVKIHLNTIY